LSFSEIPQRGHGEIYGSGFQGLDDKLRFGMVTPELVIITGAPGSGKSEWSAILGANLANYHKLPGAIMQFEDRSIRVGDTLARYATGNVPGVTNRTEARAWVDRWFKTIEPDQNMDTDYTLDWLKDTIREARVRHGCRWVIIDPWNEIEHVWDRTQTEAVYTNEALRRLKKISRSLDIILMIIAHPSKDGGRNQEIQNLDLYSISGAAAWANKADHGIIVHRPDHSKEDVYIKVAKSKDHSVMGSPGIVRMKYMPASGQYKYVGMGV
jgi:twinkle protein